MVRDSEKILISMIGTLDFFQRIQPYPYGKHIKRVDMKESGTFQG